MKEDRERSVLDRLRPEEVAELFCGYCQSAKDRQLIIVSIFVAELM